MASMADADDNDPLGDTDGLDDDTERALRKYLANPNAASTLIGYRWEDGLVAPWQPCDDAALKDALRFLQPNADDLVVDLGCGDGRVLTHIAQLFGCRCMGVELDAEVASRAEAAFAELPTFLHDRMEVRRADLFEVAATWTQDGVERPGLLVLYLLPDGLKRLGPLLQPLLPYGSRVCTLRWELPGWEEHRQASGPGWHVYGSGSVMDSVAA